MSPSRVRTKLQVKEPRAMTPGEVLELQQINLIVGCENFKASEMEKNTALIPNGTEAAAQQRAIAQVMSNARTTWIQDKIAELGYAPNEKLTIDMHTGVVTRV